MVSFIWGDYRADTTDESQKNNLITEFETHIRESRNNKFYDNLMNAFDALEDNPEEEEAFAKWIKTEIVDVVLDQPLEKWIKDSEGYIKFIESRRLKTGKLTTLRRRKETGDRRKFETIVTGGGQTIIPNKKNIEFLEGKTLKDILDTAVVRRLAGLEHLRQAAQKEPELEEEAIEELFLDYPISRYELWFKEKTNNYGVPTGKFTYGTANNTDKPLKNYSCHMLLEWPSMDEESLKDSLPKLADDRVKLLSDELGQELEATKKYKQNEIEEFTFKHDFSIPESFIQSYSDELSDRRLERDIFMGDEKEISAEEAEKTVMNAYRRYVNRYNKAEKKSIEQNKLTPKLKKPKPSAIDSELEVEQYMLEIDKDNKELIERKLTTEEYRNTHKQVPEKKYAQPTTEVMDAFSENSEDGKTALIPYDYVKEEWVKVKTPVKWKFKDLSDEPIRVEFDDENTWNKLEEAISKEVEKRAVKWPALKEAKYIRGIRVAATITTGKQIKDSLAAYHAKRHGKIEAGKKVEEEDWKIGSYYALVDDKGKEIPKKIDEEKSTENKSVYLPWDKEESKGKKKIINQNQFNDLSREEQDKFWTFLYTPFDYLKEGKLVQEAERKDELMYVHPEQGVTEWGGGEEKYKTATIDSENPNDDLKEAKIKLKCFTVQWGEVDIMSERELSGNKKLIDDVDKIKSKIREVLEEVDEVI